MPDLTSSTMSTTDAAPLRSALDAVAVSLSSSLDASHDALRPEERAAEIIRRTVAQFPAEKIAISFNGGKDAVVMLELILRSQGLEWLKRCCLFVLVDTEGEFPEIVAFRKRYVAERLPGVTLNEVQSPDGMKVGLWRALERYRFSAVFMGTRKDDPSGKYQQVPWKVTTDGWPPMVRVCPILSWTFNDVWEYTMSNKIPFCDLYQRGYTSLGHCKVTSPNSRLQKQDGSYAPAWTLSTQDEERAGRLDHTT